MHSYKYIFVSNFPFPSFKKEMCLRDVVREISRTKRFTSSPTIIAFLV